jgi:integrase
VRDSALVLGNLDGTHRHPGRFSRRFVAHVVQARRALGEEQLPMIRLHDLRHPRDPAAGAGEPVKVVSERLGHASATITLTVHQHVHPGMGGKPRTASSHCSTIDGDTAPEPPSITAV